MKRTYKIVFVMLVSCALLFISACGQAENNEEETSAESGYEKVLKVKGGPDAYNVFLDDTEEWSKLDGHEKIVLIDKSISLCEVMDPADSFEVSGFLKKDEKAIFYWESTNPADYYEQTKDGKVLIEE